MRFKVRENVKYAWHKMKLVYYLNYLTFETLKSFLTRMSAQIARCCFPTKLQTFVPVLLVMIMTSETCIFTTLLAGNATSSMLGFDRCYFLNSSLVMTFNVIFNDIFSKLVYLLSWTCKVTFIRCCRVPCALRDSRTPLNEISRAIFGENLQKESIQSRSKNCKRTNYVLVYLLFYCLMM